MAYEDLLKTYEKWEDRMQHHGVGNMPFCVAFCGVFSSGKSSLLNALLDCGNVLPTGINPVTKIITRIRYGKSIALHCIVDGNTVSVPKTDMNAVITGKKALPKGCTELIVDVPARILKNNVEFIDTPGYEDDAALEDMSRAAVLTADYIVFCCNSTMLGKQFEKQYLQELKQTHGNYCMVVNRMDCLNTDEDFENVKRTAGRLMLGCGIAAHPEQNQGKFFLTIAAGVYATLNGLDEHMKTLLSDDQERVKIRHSTNQCFTAYHKEKLLALIKEERTAYGIELKRLHQKDDARREKAEIEQKVNRMKLDQKIEKAKLYVNSLVRPKRNVLENKINGMTNPSTFVEDVKPIVRAEVSDLIDSLARYSEQNELMAGEKVRNDLNQFLLCIVPAPTYREEQQRGILGRVFVSTVVSVLTRSPYIDDGTELVCNDYKAPAIKKVNNHFDNFVQKWNKLLNDYKSKQCNDATTFTPDPQIASIRDEIGKLAELEEKMKSQEKLLSAMALQADPAEMVNYISQQVNQFRNSIMQLPLASNICKKLNNMLSEWECGSFEICFEGGYGVGKSSLINALLGREIIPTAFGPDFSVPTKIQIGRQEKIEFTLRDGGTIVVPLERDSWYTLRDMAMQDENGLGIIEKQTIYVNNGENRPGLFAIKEAGINYTEDWLNSQHPQAAKAVVHVIDATMPFTKIEEEYISEHYAEKHMQNLFFVFNRLDCVGEDAVPLLKKVVSARLSKVFTKQDGSFDEKLFRERVFYTSAYCSLMARIGKTFKLMGKEVVFDDNITGVPEFEMALKNYVFEQNRIKTSAYPIFRYMCQAYGTLFQQLCYAPTPLSYANKNLNNLCMLLCGEPLTEKRRQEIANGK